MRFGEFVTEPTPWPLTSSSSVLAETAATLPYPVPSSLYRVALQWLAEDREYRRELEKQGRKTRGARKNAVWNVPPCLLLSSHIVSQLVPSDSETFYRKYVPSFHRSVAPNRYYRYDYSH